MTQIRPLGNRVLVERSKAPTTKGGILLPDSAKEKQKEGTVLAVGPGKQREDGTIEPMTVKKGDVVLFTSYAGTEVKTDANNDNLLILSEEDILGILTNK